MSLGSRLFCATLLVAFVLSQAPTGVARESMGDMECQQVASVPGVEQEPLSFMRVSPPSAVTNSPVDEYHQHHGPGISNESSFAWDARAGLLVMWGGHGRGYGGPQINDTWTFDFATREWTHRFPPTSPMGACCVREMVYDRGMGRSLTLGGHYNSHGWQWPYDTHLRGGVPWAYDAVGNEWTPMRPIIHGSPGRRPFNGMAYDPDDQVTVVFSGEGRPGDIWVYDGYENVWYPLEPDGPRPEGRRAGGFAYDAVNKVFVMHSGIGGYTDTWVYDLRRNQWTECDSDPRPPESPCGFLEYDLRNRAMLYFRVRTEEEGGGFEVWRYHTGRNEWEKVESKNGTSPFVYNLNGCSEYVPELNLTVLGHGIAWPDPFEVWTYRYGDGKAGADELPAPSGIDAVTDRGEVNLSWERPDDGRVVSFSVWRGSGEKPWLVEYEQIATGVKGTAYTDRMVASGSRLFYYVSSEDAEGNQSQPSAKVRTQPRVPLGLVASVRDSRTVELSWRPSPESDVLGYNVYRCQVDVKAADPTRHSGIAGWAVWSRVNDELISEDRLVDRGVDLKETAGTEYQYAMYAYVVRAVNQLGVESGASPFARTVPDFIRNVCATVEEDQVTLIWDPSPENVIGYQVYRLEAREDQEAVRLTQSPVAETTFVDRPPEGTKRYYVAGVDVLGQEGLPSNGCWIHRPWTW